MKISALFWVRQVSRFNELMHDLLKREMASNDWRLRVTARDLGLSAGKLMRLMERCGLSDEYHARKHPPGWPQRSDY